METKQVKLTLENNQMLHHIIATAALGVWGGDDKSEIIEDHGEIYDAQDDLEKYWPIVEQVAQHADDILQGYITDHYADKEHEFEVYV